MCASGCDGSGDGSGDGGGDASDGWSSTPFLATWDGVKFNLENDFLFGKPNTNRASTFDLAQKMYESNVNRGDKYIIQNTIKKRDGKFIFQIKEIEPEVSYIDHFSISYFKHQKTKSPIVTSDHESILFFEKNRMAENQPKQQIIFNKKENISKEMQSRLVSIFNNQKYDRKMFLQEMQPNEIIEIEATGLEESQDVYLILESKFRDWTLGELLKEKNRITSGFYFLNLKNFLDSPRQLIRSFSLILVFLLSYIGFGVNRNFEQKNESILSKAFDLQTVYADVPAKSLKISYLQDASYQHIDVIEPRYYQSSTQAIKIPKEAIKNSSVSLRIYSTKKHHVTCAAVITAKNLEEAVTEKLKLVKAYHRRLGKDFTEILSKKNNEYMETWPGDIVDVEFEAPQEEIANELSLVLQADGFYSCPSKKITAENGDWVSRLDKESLSFLKELEAANQGRVKNSRLLVKS